MAGKRKDVRVLISSTQQALRVPRKRLTGLIRFLARAEGADLAEVDLAVVGRAEMISLNQRYLGREEQTDVLSFDLTRLGHERMTVQIVLCGPVAVEQAAKLGTGPHYELMLYTVHGLLHLLGYGDSSPAETDRMHAREKELLDRFARRRRS